MQKLCMTNRSFIQVTGDRGPEDVYRDFKHVFYNIVRDIKNVDNVDAANLPNNDRNSDNNEDEILDLGKKTLIWVVGGPGSKKYERVMQAMTDFENWKVISTGKKINNVLHYFLQLLKANCCGTI